MLTLGYACLLCLLACFKDQPTPWLVFLHCYGGGGGGRGQEEEDLYEQQRKQRIAQNMGLMRALVDEDMNALSALAASTQTSTPKPSQRGLLKRKADPGSVKPVRYRWRCGPCVFACVPVD